MSLLHLFFIFVYVGFFAVGGGPIAMTFMQQTIVEQYNLISAEKFYSMIAISESTPGPIGINLATYIGCELYGTLGGIITTFGEVLPSLVVIIIIAKFFAHFQDYPVIKSVFKILRPVTSGLVLVMLVQIFALALFLTHPVTLNGFFSNINFKALAFYAVALTILFKTKLHPVVVVVLGGIFGVAFL